MFLREWTFCLTQNSCECHGIYSIGYSNANDYIEFKDLLYSAVMTKKLGKLIYKSVKTTNQNMYWVSFLC